MASAVHGGGEENKEGRGARTRLHHGAFLLEADCVVALHRLQRDRTVFLKHQQVPEQGVYVVVRLRRGLQEPAAPGSRLCSSFAQRHLAYRWTLVTFVPHLVKRNGATCQMFG